MFRNKGALVALTWIFCGFCILLSLYSRLPNEEWQLGILKISPAAAITPCLLLYPIFGWLADAKFGRYKVIKWSFISLWVLAVPLCALSVLQILMGSTVRSYLNYILYLPLAVNLGGVVANTIQFGVEQLADAPSVEVTRFIRWAGWTWFLGSVIGATVSSFQGLSYILYPTIVTLAISTDLLCNNWLDKQTLPVGNYLLKIAKMLLYVKKHHYPTIMAPNDWDVRSSARLDVAKHEYGGPFTSEEVEDVKSFLRILVIIVVCSFFIGLYQPTFQLYYPLFGELMQKKYGASNQDLPLGERFTKLSCIYSGDLLMVVCIPFFEFIIKPLLKRRCSVTILQKLLLGVVFANLSVASMAAIALSAEFANNEPTNATVCSIATSFNDASLDYHWMVIPYVLDSAMEFMLLTSATEFICAQCPYSMKSLIFGVLYGCLGFFSITGFLVSAGLKKIINKWLFRPVGCGFWYFFLLETLLLFILLICALLVKCYKKRNRQDKSDYLFAVHNYF